MKTRTKTYHRLTINRKENGWDELACRLGRRGWTAATVAKATNLSEGQVRTRWKKYGISPMDERHGISPDAKRFLAATRRMLNGMVVRAPQRV